MMRKQNGMNHFNNRNDQIVQKHQRKNDTLSKNAGHRPASLLKNVTLPQMLCTHFASKNQLPDFYISGTLG